MKWVGLTGGIATGKSTVAKILRDLSLPVVDADSIAREVTSPNSIGLSKVVSEFGTEILDATGALNRKYLADVIFSDPIKRQRLEEILHPLIQEVRATERLELERRGCELAFYDVPLLFEKKMKGEFDAVVLVYARPEVQKRRLQERDHLTDVQISERLLAQIAIDEKIKLADFVIFNNGSLSELKANVQAVVKELGLSKK